MRCRIFDNFAQKIRIIYKTSIVTILRSVKDAERCTANSPGPVGEHEAEEAHAAGGVPDEVPQLAVVHLATKVFLRGEARVCSRYSTSSIHCTFVNYDLLLLRIY